MNNIDFKHLIVQYLMWQNSVVKKIKQNKTKPLKALSNQEPEEKLVDKKSMEKMFHCLDAMKNLSNKC